MKTTIEMADDLCHRVRALAALRGCAFSDLVEEGLRQVLAKSGTGAPTKSLAKVLIRASGLIDSGIADLASNPNHLERFGRDSLHNGKRRLRRTLTGRVLR